MKKLILTICFCFIASLSFADEYYIDQWRWVEVDTGWHWEAPHQEYHTGSIDLRSIPQASKFGGVPEGYGLFSYSQQVGGLIYLGNNIDGVVSKKIKKDIKEVLGVKITKGTLKNILWEILTVEADPTGETKVKPLMPGKDKKIELHIGKKKLKEVALVPYESPEWENVLAVIHEDYRRMINTEPHYIIAKVLDMWEEKYNLPYETFIPIDVIRIASLPHETTLNEDFNCSAADELDCDLQWTEIQGDIDIVSNDCRTQGSTWNEARADHDLSSDDHYSQIEATTSATSRGYSVLARKDSSATLTFYRTLCFNTGTDFWRTDSMVAGSETEIGSSTNDTCGSTDVLKIEVDGSSVKRYKNGALQNTATDSNITGNVRAGVGGYNSDQRMDNWEASDLAAAAGRSRRFF